MKTRLTAPAQRQADRMDRWWREHRPTTADLFSRELQTALRSIAHVPELGAHYAEHKGTPVLRVLLPKTHNHVYYVVDREHEQVLVLALWGAPRGRGPKC